MSMKKKNQFFCEQVRVTPHTDFDNAASTSKAYKMKRDRKKERDIKNKA